MNARNRQALLDGTTWTFQLLYSPTHLIEACRSGNSRSHTGTHLHRLLISIQAILTTSQSANQHASGNMTSQACSPVDQSAHLRAGPTSRLETQHVFKRQNKNSATGTRTRVALVRAEYPNQLDYSGDDIRTLLAYLKRPVGRTISPNPIRVGTRVFPDSLPGVSVLTHAR